jgi:hypothetical protein
MGQQSILSFGGLTLVDPSDGVSGYVMGKYNHARVDYSEVSHPGTAGRVKIILGRGQSDQSSLKLEFRCSRRFSSEGALHNFLEDAAVAASSTVNNLRTVQYGLINEGGLYQAENCDMEFMLAGEPWKDGEGYTWCDFTVSFAQWGED